MREKINEKIMYTMYKRNSKWLGIIDYKSLCFILIYMFILINILDFLNLNLETSIYIFLFLTVPVICILVININQESAITVIFYIFKFFLNRKNRYKKNNI